MWRRRLESGRARRHALLQWLFLAAVLNLAWEIAQLPLYTIFHQGRPGQIAFAVAHCTAGDVLIALACYLAASAVTRDLVWPWHRPSSGGAVAIVTGVAYTVFSEWLHASVRGSWAYTESMPRISSLGLTPLLQWLAVPLVTLWLIRAGKRST
jgi:hypothetical protein